MIIPSNTEWSEEPDPPWLNDVLGELQSLSGPDGVRLDPSATFAALGFDSLALARASVALQKRFHVPIPFRRFLEDLATPREVAAWLAEKLPSASKNGRAAGHASRRGENPLSVSDNQPMETTPGLPAPTADATTPGRTVRAASRRREVARAPEFTPDQRAHLDTLIAHYCARTAASKGLTAHHRPHLADPRAVSGFRRAWKEMIYPIVTERSAGSKLWDLDGNEYVDITLGFGQNLLGHRPPFVVEAVQRQLQSGIEIGPTSPLAGEVAALMCEFTGHERAAFCNTGSEAVTAALRIARTVTGRSKIAIFAGAYHGNFDEVLGRAENTGGEARAIPIAPGIEAGAFGNVIILDYGDESALATIRARAGELAAVLVEPVQSRRPGLQPRAFLHELRSLTAEHDIALVVDEVLTGFRVHPGGAQAWFGFKADIAAYGKAVGGGFPIGIVTGSSRYLDALDGGAWNYGDDSFPQSGVTFFAGTFARNPLALAATLAVLQHLKSIGGELQEKLNTRTAALVTSLNAHFDARGLPLRWTRFSSIYHLTTPPELRHSGLLWFHLRARGIYAWESRPSFLSTAHNDTDIARIVEGFTESVDAMIAGGFLPTPRAKAAVNPSAPTFAANEMGVTTAQRDLLAATRSTTEASRSCNAAISVRLRGDLDHSALRRAVNRVITRHDALRAVFESDGGRARILDAIEIELPVTEWPSSDEPPTDFEWNGLREAEIAQPFDLTAGPLLRARLFKRSDTDHELVLTLHRIICDEWSLHVIIREVASLCQASADDPLPDAPQFRDYARRLEEQQRSGRFDETKSFWLREYADPVPRLELPVDRAMACADRLRIDRRDETLPADLVDDVKRFSATHRCTVFATMLAAFYVLIHRLTGQNDIVIGITAAGQVASAEPELVGHCVKTLPLRGRIDRAASFATFLGDIRTLVLDATEHQNFAFGMTDENGDSPRHASRPPAPRVFFQIEHDMSVPEFGDLRAACTTMPGHDLGSDLSLRLVASDRTWDLRCAFNADLFEGETIARWLQHYVTLLNAMVDNPERAVGQMPLLTPSERQQLLTDGTGAESTDPDDASVPALFEESAARTPDAIALVDGTTWLSYAELNAAANRIARFLQENGIGAGDFVGVPAVRNARFVAAILGVLKAGAAYAPLDLEEPPGRLQAMRESCRLVLDLEREPGTGEGDHLPRVAKMGESACLLFGTAGGVKPNGVVVPQRAISRLVADNECVVWASNEVIAFASNLSGASGLFEIWGTLLHGGTLVVTPTDILFSAHALAAHLVAHSVTTLLLTSALFNEIARQAPSVFSALRNVVIDGETADPEAFATVLAHGPPKRLVHAYGHAETTGFAICHRVDAPPPSRLFMGRPIACAKAYVLDEEHQPVPVGVSGEIYIGGTGLATGYRDKPELTAERFVDTPHGRLFRTGDAGRWLPNGMLEYRGRRDRQIVLRGFRIEPREIESVLRRVPGVADCVVASREVAPRDLRLVAYFTESNGTVEAAALRSALRRIVPFHMVPSAFLRVDTLPQTRGGTVDLEALPTPHRDMERTDFAPPESLLHTHLIELWETLLKRRPIGIRDDFFELGGHSLLAMQMLHELAARIGRTVSLKTLYANATIAHLAKTIVADERREACKSECVQVNAGAASATPLFFVHGDSVGGAFYCQRLAEHLGAGMPFYEIDLLARRGATDLETLEATAESLVARARAVQPDGPYLLGGLADGALIAFEMARQLEARGEAVSALLLLAADGSQFSHRSKARLVPFREVLRWRRRSERARTSAAASRHETLMATETAGEKMANGDGNSENDSVSTETGVASNPVERPVCNALETFVPGHYNGRLVLLWPRDDRLAHGDDPRAGWSSVCPHTELVLIPGQRQNSLAREENLHEVALAIRHALEPTAPAVQPRSRG